MKTRPSHLTTASTRDHIIEIAKLAHFGFLLPEAADEFMRTYQNKDFENLFLHAGDLGHFPIFLLVRNELEDKQYFHFLGKVLTGECYASDFPNLIRTLLSERPLQARLYLMNEEDQTLLKQQPITLTIYRGASPHAVCGFSWTLSLKHAKFFAQRHLSHGRDAGVFQGNCKKQDIIAYFSREEEVFIDPHDIQNITPIELLPKTCKEPSSNPKYCAYLQIREYLQSKHLLPFQ